MTNWLHAQSWRGYDGEKDMTEDDWKLRAHQQAMAMYHAGSAEFSSPDEDGQPTQGDYNGDYSDEYHEQLNQRLDEDEYYEAEVEQDLKTLKRVQDGL